MQNLKKIQLVTITKRSRPTETENKVVITSREREEGLYRGGGVGGTKYCKIGLRMYSVTWGILPIFYNKCKWKVTFKIVQFLKLKQKL